MNADRTNSAVPEWQKSGSRPRGMCSEAHKKKKQDSNYVEYQEHHDQQAANPFASKCDRQITSEFTMMHL
jgi:hypothetical protein